MTSRATSERLSLKFEPKLAISSRRRCTDRSGRLPTRRAGLFDLDEPLAIANSSDPSRSEANRWAFRVIDGPTGSDKGECGCSDNGARGGTRTLTPRRAGGFKPPTSAGYATRAGAVTVGDRSRSRRRQAATDPGPTAPTPPMAASNVARTRAATSSTSAFATTTPSIMSATTSAGGRERTRTATTGPPGSRRIVRGTPGRRGGVRNAGHTRPAARAAALMRRARSANRIGGVTSIGRIEYPR